MVSDTEKSRAPYQISLPDSNAQASLEALQLDPSDQANLLKAITAAGFTLEQPEQHYFDAVNISDQIYRANTASTTEALNAIFKETALKLGLKVGFSGVLLGNNVFYSETYVQFDTTVNDHDVGWFENYLVKEYTKTDPTYAKVMAMEVAFTWADVVAELTPKSFGRAVFDGAREYNLIEGLVTPVPIFRDGKGGITVMGPEGCISELSDRQRQELSDFCFACFVRFDYLLQKDKPDPKPVLTPREFSVMRLLQNAHTTEEIAEYIGIEPASAQKLITRMLPKFKVSNRTQLWALLLRTGWRY